MRHKQITVEDHNGQRVLRLLVVREQDPLSGRDPAERTVSALREEFNDEYYTVKLRDKQ